MFKLAWLFNKISGVEIDLIKVRPEYEDIIWYFSDRDKTPGKKATIWAVSRIDAGEPQEQVDEAFNFIINNNLSGFKGLTSDQIYNTKGNKDFSSDITGKEEKEEEEEGISIRESLKSFIKDNGIKFILQGDDSSSMLGEGGFSSVYDIDINGKNYVMKVSPYKDEYKSYKKIKEERDKLPEFVAKHFPIIYFSDLIKGNGYNGHPLEYSIIIMEKLYPFGKDLEYSTSSINSDIDKKYKKRDILDRYFSESLKKAIDDISSMPGNDLKLNAYKICDFIENSNFYKKEYESSTPLIDYDHDDSLDNIGKYIGFVLSSVYNVNESNSDKISKSFKRIVRNVNFKYNDPIVPNSMGFSTSNKESDDMSYDRKVAEFNRAMRYIFENKIIMPEDINERNIMVRKSDGAIVVSDVGMFKLFEKND